MWAGSPAQMRASLPCYDGGCGGPMDVLAGPAEVWEDGTSRFLCRGSLAQASLPEQFQVAIQSLAAIAGRGDPHRARSTGLERSRCGNEAAAVERELCGD